MDSILELFDDIYDDIGAEQHRSNLAVSLLWSKAHSIIDKFCPDAVQVAKSDLVDLLVVFNKLRQYGDDAELYNRMNIVLLDIIGVI
jgi:hypothetical protein